VLAVDTRTTLAFGVSLLLHLAVVFVALGAPVTPNAVELPRADVWTGHSVEIESLALPAVAPAPAAQPAAVAPPANPLHASEARPATPAMRPAAVSPPPVAVAEAPAAASKDEYGEQWMRIEDQLPASEEPSGEPSIAANPERPID
jgi:hypothetical protein